jgi:hypothetical protein
VAIPTPSGGTPIPTLTDASTRPTVVPSGIGGSSAPPGLVNGPATLIRPKDPLAPFNIIGRESIFAPLPPIQWLCQSLYIAPGAPVLIAGYGYSGKSVAAQALALSVASGRIIWGKFAVRTGRVLHLDYEQGARLSRARYQRLAVQFQLRPDEIEDRLELGVLPSVGLSADYCKRLGEGRDLVLIDSWRAAHPGIDENSSEVRQTLDAMAYASEATGAVFVTLHHAKKVQDNAPSDQKYSIRGSSGFFDGCQTVFILDGSSVGHPVVHLAKERITGAKMEPFTLDVEDTYNGLGLAIVHGGAVQAAHKEDYAETSGRILAFIRLNQGIAGADALALKMGMGAPKARSYLKSMESEGRIIVDIAPGRGRGVRIYTKDYVRQDAPF